jgi:hypothetical protein
LSAFQPPRSPRRSRRIRRAITVVLYAVMLLTTAGCEDPPEIKKYSAKLDKSEESRSRLASYTLPAGWKRSAEPKQMVTAGFQIADAGNVFVTLSRFPGDVGGLVANVNRWRKKVGLQESTPEQIKKDVVELKADGETVSYVDVSGKDPENVPLRILGALVRPARSPVIWVFTMQGNPEAVGRHKTEFEAFVESVKFGMGANDG